MISACDFHCIGLSYSTNCYVVKARTRDHTTKGLPFFLSKLNALLFCSYKQISY